MKETRFTPLESAELRVFESNGKATIRGYAALFNNRSQDLGGFVEQIAPGAFDAVLADDVRALVNHDANLILGRRSAGTLTLSVDDRGLAYEITPPDSALAAHYVEAIRRGDISGSSFAFFTESDSWDNPGGVPVRTILKFASLLDVGPVTYPAYADTSVALRSMERATKPAIKGPNRLGMRQRYADITSSL